VKKQSRKKSAKKTTRRLDLKTEILALVVLDTLQTLKDRGLINGGYSLDQNGRDFAKWLRERGFEPSREELEQMTRQIVAESWEGK